MSSSTLSWYSINNTGDVLTFSGDKFQVEGDVDITGNYYINGEPVLTTGSQLATLGEVLPVGSFINYPWPSSPSEPSIPFGFLKCNGAEISSIIYSELYTVIGNKYGTPTGAYGFVLPNFSNLIIKYRTTATPSSSDLVPIASIFTIPWTINPYPAGFLKCDGSAVSREDYTILYNVIGDIYGNGDGSTTFNLPNLFNQGIKYRSTIVSSTGTIQETSWTNIGNYIYYQDRVGVGTIAPRKNLDVVGTSIFTGGNVGIGTIDPVVNVDIRTSSGIGPELRLSETSESYSKISFYGTSGTTYFHVSSIVSTTEATNALCRMDMNLGSPSRTVMSILGSGRVGIGLTNPGYVLHLGSNGESFENFNTSLYAERTVVADSFYARGTFNPSYFGGKVGIGTTIPNGDIHVYKSAPATIYLHDASQGSSFVANGWRLDHGTNGSNVFGIVQNGIEETRLAITDTGNVGIGTVNPAAKLHLHSDQFDVLRLRSSAGPHISLDNGNPSVLSYISMSASSAPGIRSNALEINNGHQTGAVTFTVGGNVSSPQMVLASNGKVGIGITNPLYPLTVNNYYRDGITYYGSFNPGGHNNTPASTFSFSAWFQWDIVASVFVARSDSRIKKNIREIDDGVALSKLRLIEPTEYQYIDSVRKGTSRVFGFIAQQVREHFPEATKLMKEVVPDVYSLCLSNIDAQVIHLSGNARDGKLRLITKTRQLDVEVIASTSDVVQLPEGTLTEEDLHEGQIFVYGYEVEDFHALNKDYLFTINFAATQELDRKVQTLETELLSLRAENSELNARLTALELLLKAQTSTQT